MTDTNPIPANDHERLVAYMLEFRGSLDVLSDLVVGHKQSLMDRGLSEEAAESCATALHNVFVAQALQV